MLSTDGIILIVVLALIVVALSWVVVRDEGRRR